MHLNHQPGPDEPVAAGREDGWCIGTVADLPLGALQGSGAVNSLRQKSTMPVVSTLGTKCVIVDNTQWWQDSLRQQVSILAMNEDEALEYAGLNVPLTALNIALEWVDLVLCITGPSGLYTAGYIKEAYKRETQYLLLPGHIVGYNRYEFSRATRRESCEHPLRVYSHLGGSEKIMIPTATARYRCYSMISPPTAFTATTCQTPANICAAT